jgi:hypothetical protein
LAITIIIKKNLYNKERDSRVLGANPLAADAAALSVISEKYVPIPLLFFHYSPPYWLSRVTDDDDVGTVCVSVGREGMGEAILLPTRFLHGAVLLVVFSMPGGRSGGAEEAGEDRATLHDAEEHWNIGEESAKLRLKELEEVAYDIEDVVDEYDYEVDRCRLAAPDPSAGVHNTHHHLCAYNYRHDQAPPLKN